MDEAWCRRIEKSIGEVKRDVAGIPLIRRDVEDIKQVQKDLRDEVRKINGNAREAGIKVAILEEFHEAQKQVNSDTKDAIEEQKKDIIKTRLEIAKGIAVGVGVGTPLGMLLNVGIKALTGP